MKQITAIGGGLAKSVFTVHGADAAGRAVLQSAAQKPDRLSRWAMALRARRGYHRAIIAVAAKNARIIWALLANNREFAPPA